MREYSPIRSVTTYFAATCCSRHIAPNRDWFLRATSLARFASDSPGAYYHGASFSEFATYFSPVVHTRTAQRSAALAAGRADAARYAVGWLVRTHARIVPPRRAEVRAVVGQVA